jgi:uncharacterized protein (UPF0332 family)
MTTADVVAVADYVAQADEFLDHAREYLAADRLHQASEKGWGAAAHMAKAVAEAQGWEYKTHADFSVVLNQARRLTDDARLGDLRATANDLHGNYYRRKRHLDADVIGEDIEKVAELVALLAPLTAPPR